MNRAWGGWHEKIAYFVILLVGVAASIKNVSAGKWETVSANETPITLTGWPESIEFRYRDGGFTANYSTTRYAVFSRNTYINNKTFINLEELQPGYYWGATFQDKDISDYPFFNKNKGFFKIFAEARFKPGQKTKCGFEERSCSFFKVDFTLEGNECSYVSYIEDLGSGGPSISSPYAPAIILIHCGNVKPFTEENFRIDFRNEKITIEYPDYDKSLIISKKERVKSVTKNGASSSVKSRRVPKDDRTLCEYALTGQRTGWAEAGWPKDVAAAKSRGFSIEDCRRILGEKEISSKSTRPIAVQWDGFGELIAGTVESRPSENGGKISFVLPKNKGTCRGRYRFTDGLNGVWSVACTNGIAASGTMRGYGKYKGSSGEGEDASGRKVKFTVGAANR